MERKEKKEGLLDFLSEDYVRKKINPPKKEEKKIKGDNVQ